MFDPSYATTSPSRETRWQEASSKDAPKVHSVTKDGTTVFLTRKDPYGHIYLTLEQGEVSPKYQGAYTDMRIAEYDANRYLDDRIQTMADLKVTKRK